MTSKLLDKPGQTRKKRKRLNPDVKRNYDRWLHKEYYGEKIEIEQVDTTTGEMRTAEKIVAVNPKRSINFWKEKNGLTGRQKKETVCDLFRLYRRGDVFEGELISFVNEISQTKIVEHNEGLATHYYCCDPFAPVVNLMFDWDDKQRAFGDTEAAARWLNQAFLSGQSFVQTSTSGTGTHQYVFVRAEGVSVPDQKRVYKELIQYLRHEVGGQGFRCWAGLDQIKGVGPEVSWHESSRQADKKNPWFLRIDKGGVFAKFPRLSSAQDQAAWLDRKALTWQHLTDLLGRLRRKYAAVQPQQGGAETELIDGCVTGTVAILLDDLDDAVGAEVGRQVVGHRLRAMFENGGKQQVALASVFKFENTHARRPEPVESDFVLLNGIYNDSPTATGTMLTDDRRKRFGTAIRYSAGREPISKKRLITPEMIEKASNYFGGVDLTATNQKLVRQKQRTLTTHDLARCWCYFVTAIKSKAGTSEEGRVPWKALKGLSDSDRKHDAEAFPKQSRNAVTAILKLFLDPQGLGLIRKVVEHDRISGDCAKYEIVKDPLRGT